MDVPVPTTSSPTTTVPGLFGADGQEFASPPEVPDGPLDPALVDDLETLMNASSLFDVSVVERIGASGDARVAWLLSDFVRIVQRGEMSVAAAEAFEQLTGDTLPGIFAWGEMTDRLLAWDTPAPPGYADIKAILFVAIEPAWAPFFADQDADIDWRHLSWGGVSIDNRPIDEVDRPCPLGCIPALNDPAVTDANGGDWYPDERVVFGVEVNGEVRAYPKNIMEVHEMVNDTLGGREIGMPYCTLCGSAQAYFTDNPPEGFETIELRTSGLLVRSNKVMFDLHTNSVFDTFVGTAVSGPLQDEDLVLEQITVVVTTWAEWKEQHPETTIVAKDGGIGREYRLDPLGSRDDDGPIFPIGDVDGRLPTQEQVLGVITEDGTPVAFPAAAALIALKSDSEVELGGVTLRVDGGGLRATLSGGDEAVSHQSFWFAWSQFHPETLLWNPATTS